VKATTTALFFAALVGLSSGAITAATPKKDADRILHPWAIQGGLIVHLGCGNGQLTAALGEREQYLVQGLDKQPARVAAAQDHIRSLGGNGRVTARQFSGKRLPYVDNLVNVLVVEDNFGLPPQELQRVVAPGGFVWARTGDGWISTGKPSPGEIDEWTHFLYDSSNNAVSQDTIVGPPKQLQWVGAPRWARSHDHLATVSAVVSSGGRIFSIVDEGPTASILLPSQWNLIAQDAFNGVVLWKREIPVWQWHLRGFRSGPSDLARRLVAADGRVYVTLGINSRVSALDPATGKTLAEYDGTDYAREILYNKGTLYVVTGGPWAETTIARAERRGMEEVRTQRPDYLEEPPAKRILAIDTRNGQVLWQKGDSDTLELLPTTLTVADGRVYFQNANQLHCLDATSGAEVWQADRPSTRSRYAWTAPTLVVVGDVVLSGDRAVAQERMLDEPSDRDVEWVVSSRGGQAPVGQLIAYSAKDGKQLWTSTAKDCYNAPPDVLVADNLVWTGTLVRASEPGITQGLEVATGDVGRTRPVDQEFFQVGMGHHRCYRNKATEKFLLLGRSGVEFIDVKTGHAAPHHWTRGTCQYGIMPANGLLYVPPHSCACFIASKLNGYNCFAPRRESMPGGVSPENRLKKGPAHDTPLSATHSLSSDWPTYRQDAARSGHTTSKLPAELTEAWQAELGGRLSSVVVADGRLFVAQIETHTIYSLDAETGKTAWSFVAGGRVDSPPTVWQGRVYFGSADGYLYCLTAETGTLVWRYLAAPSDTQIVSYGQLESAWPLHGSVLVRDGIVCAAAGRSSYLDGGIRLVRLDAETGERLSETVVDDRDPETNLQKKGVVRGTDMPGALPDVLSTDGTSLFMRHRRFTMEGEQQASDVPHLYSAAGFLDGSWWHRTYWQFGQTMGNAYGGWPKTGNQNPAGRILSVAGGTIYGFGRNQYIHHGAHVGLDGATVYHFKPDRDAQKRETYYQLFAIDKPTPLPAPKSGRRAPRPKAKQYRWTRQLPMLARAMVTTDELVFVAGTPDVFESEDPTAALIGKSGGLLRIVDQTNGQTRSELTLASPPVWDGMAAADGRLFMATLDGKVVSYGKTP
jgi:outer membrane protein assembly factor BamB